MPSRASEKNDRLWVGPQIQQRTRGPHSLQARLGNGSSPCSLLKGNSVTAGTRQLSFVNIFFSCVMSEKDTHTHLAYEQYIQELQA